MTPKSYHCPCGCGQALVAESGGRRPLMCRAAWARMPSRQKCDFAYVRTDDAARRVAVRKMLERCKAMNAAAVDAQQLNLF